MTDETLAADRLFRSHRLRLAISILDSEPAIWRVLDVDGGLTLGQLHQVIQLSFGWNDVHLHEFAWFDFSTANAELGIAPDMKLRWGPTGNDYADLDGPVERFDENDWSIDAAFVATGHTQIDYIYDFGDAWHVVIELVERGDDHEAPFAGAVALDGRFAGPVEDSGGIESFSELASVLRDPGHENHEEAASWVKWVVGPMRSYDPDDADLAALNAKLAAALGPDDPDRDAPPAVRALFDRMPPAAAAAEWRAYAQRYGAFALDEVDTATATAAMAPLQALLEAVGAEGIQLTGAGWLPPSVVHGLMVELGWLEDWFGASNREQNTVPIAELREVAHRLGLVRKYRGKLVLTPAARAVFDDPPRLWDVVVDRIASLKLSDAERDALALLTLTIAADSHGGVNAHAPLVVRGMSALGWSVDPGEAMLEFEIYRVMSTPWRLFDSLGLVPRLSMVEREVPAHTRAFARALLAKLPA